MKIVHLSESDSGGGAARAAFRLHEAMRAAAADSWMVVGQKRSSDQRVLSVGSPFSRKIYERLDRLPRKFLRTQNQSHLSPGWIGSAAWRVANQQNPALLHLHWIGKGFLQIERLHQLRAPLIWSLHDMWPFAGGEHYVAGCTRYRDGYVKGNRPAFESGLDINRWIWERKRAAWSSLSDLTLFPVSHWLAARARESVLLRDRPIEVLHNAIDEKVFAPTDRHAARRELGLPIGKPLILFGAFDATNDRRKGFDLLTSALGQLQGCELELELVVFGNEPHCERCAEKLGFPTHYLGKISDEARLARVYAACDATVVPSREEAFGQTALESLACGTPVIAFRVGGLPEVVEHDISGYLADPGDVRDLAAGIHSVLAATKTADWQRLSRAGRAKIERGFTRTFQAQRCRKLYEQVLNRTSSRQTEISATAFTSAFR